MVKAKAKTSFDTILVEYQQKYNVDSLNSPNDVANLHSMIRNQLLIEKLQEQLNTLTDTNDTIDPTQVKKILDSLVALSETNIALEKTLGIDRKTRKQEASESVVDYLAALRQRAKEWLDTDERLLKVYCKACGIMVGRISGVYTTTAFDASFQCPQCKKYIITKRQERDIFFDIKDSDWRKKYPIQIQQAKRTKTHESLQPIEDEVFIGNISEYEE